jgi:hypothetical protein
MNARKRRELYLHLRRFYLDATDRLHKGREPLEVIPLEDEPDDLYYSDPNDKSYFLPGLPIQPPKDELIYASLRERMERRHWIAERKPLQEAFERDHPEEAAAMRALAEEQAARERGYDLLPGHMWAVFPWGPARN